MHRNNVAYEKTVIGGGVHSNWRRAIAQIESCSETLRVQCGEGGAGRRMNGLIVYRVSSGRVEARVWIETVTEGGRRFTVAWRI